MSSTHYRLVIIFALLLLALFFFTSDPYERSVVILDVGQGDSILITSGNDQILIDVGADRSIIDALSKYMPLTDRTIEYLIITHNHYDHYGGINDLLRYYNVNNVIFVKPDCFGKYDDNLSWNNSSYTCINRQINRLQVSDELFTLQLSIYYPDELDRYSQLKNDTKIVNTGSVSQNSSIKNETLAPDLQNKICKNENNCSLISYVKITKNNTRDIDSDNRIFTEYISQSKKGSITAFLYNTFTTFKLSVTDFIRNRSGDYILWGSIRDISEESQKLNINNEYSSKGLSQLDILLMGDAETELEEEYLEYLSSNSIDILGENGGVEVLKAGHHCSRTASSQSFIETINPISAVCSVGTDNKFGHPHAETLDLFERLGVDVYDTSIDGDIVILLQ